MTLTIIPDLYLMDKGPVPIGSQMVWWMPSEILTSVVVRRVSIIIPLGLQPLLPIE
jgi:hypothetical protein